MNAPASPITLDALRRAVAAHAAVKAPGEGRPAAVLVPLFERDGHVLVLLTKRRSDLSSHAGQISFPGGKRDRQDADLRATALREATEEVALAPEAVEVLGELDDCPTFVTNFVITPVVGVIPDRYPLVPNPGEIEYLIEAPLDAFLAPGALTMELVDRDGQQYPLIHYAVVGHVVWGATARILTQLFSILGFPMETFH